VLSNVIGLDYREILFLSDDPVDISPVLCSTVDQPDIFAETCTVRVISRAEDKIHRTRAIEECSVTNALMMVSPAPPNPYHLVYEEMMPAYGMMLEDGQLPRDPTEAVQHLRFNDWGVFFPIFDNFDELGGRS